jgi:hypothetical protein
MKTEIKDLVALVRAAAAEAANFQQRFAAEDTEARKIVDIMESFLRTRGRLVYGGAAINAHLSPETKFYDPSLYLPDYDFMTPDPLQDCADLVVQFQNEGFEDVEAKFGIHEGTYKIFVSFRPAADITFMPMDLYETTIAESSTIDGIHYASPDFLRMNMYVELSRPTGDVSRWEKVYGRLLLLNREHPIRPGHCTADPIAALGTKKAESEHAIIKETILTIGIDAGAIFLSGVAALEDYVPHAKEIVIMMSDKADMLLGKLKGIGLESRRFDALGELLPTRYELYKKKTLVAVLFETVSCHSYIVLDSYRPNFRIGSLDLLIHMYYGLHFAGLKQYLPIRIACIIQALIERESEQRKKALKQEDPPSIIPLECIGHQPSLHELKRAHRQRVQERRGELRAALRMSSSVRPRRQSKKRKKL